VCSSDLATHSEGLHRFSSKSQIIWAKESWSRCSCAPSIASSPLENPKFPPGKLLSLTRQLVSRSRWSSILSIAITFDTHRVVLAVQIILQPVLVPRQ